MEKFRTCKHKYKFEPPFSWWLEFLKFGTTLHKYVELAITDQLNDEIKDLLLQQRPVKQRFMIIQMAEKVVDKVKELWYEYIVSELSMDKTYEDIDITLEWTMDLLFKDKEWKYVIIDIKTAKSIRDDEHIEWVKQKIIYPTLFEFIYNKHIDRFEYRVLTKTNNPDLQCIVCKTKEDYADQVKAVLDDLVETEKTGARTPSYPNHTCRYCPLKGKCQEYKVL